MMQIPPPDSHHFEAAGRLYAKGKSSEALKALFEVRPALHSHPQFLTLLWDIFAQAGKWGECLEVATILNEGHPNLITGFMNRARSLRKLGRIEEAYQILLPVLEMYPSSKLVLYDLACYCAQSGRLEEAREKLSKALERDRMGELKPKVLSEPDLKPLWSEFGGK